MPPGLPPPKKTNKLAQPLTEPLPEQPETEATEPTDEESGEAED